MIKNKLTAAIIAASLSTSAIAEYIETIEIVGSPTSITVTDPHQNFTLLDNIMPAHTFSVGGVGGFAGFNERGTQANHTAVFRNGIPVNDAGAGWYDFGHDIATGSELIFITNGPDGTLYGSASMGGAVFINDAISYGSVVKYGNNVKVISSSPNDNINLTYTKVNNGSVRTDNIEEDEYVNKTFRLQSGDLGMGFVLNYAYTDYSYDYDNCWGDYTSSNDCVQEGRRHTLSVRNDNFTFGYNSNSAEYYTNGDYLSYDSDAKNYYFDARERWVYDRNLAVITGVTATREEYIDKTANQLETYALVQYQDWMDLGVRYTGDTVVSRIGLSDWGFRFSASTSYRNPNLYELNGDGAWVFANPTLDPEEGSGIEFGYGAVTAFRYEFTQGIDFNYYTNTYVNTGEYKTEGIRYSDTYSVLDGDLSVFLGYTDTDLSGVPTRKANVGYRKVFGDYVVTAQYTTQQDRGADWSGAVYDDIETVDVYVTYNWTQNFDVTLAVEDLLDRDFEVAPGYGAGGREISLTITYR